MADNDLTATTSVSHDPRNLPVPVTARENGESWLWRALRALFG